MRDGTPNPSGGLLYLHRSIRSRICAIWTPIAVFAWQPFPEPACVCCSCGTSKANRGEQLITVASLLVDASSRLLDDLLPCPSYRVPSSLDWPTGGGPDRCRESCGAWEIASLLGFKVERDGRF